MASYNGKNSVISLLPWLLLLVGTFGRLKTIECPSHLFDIRRFSHGDVSLGSRRTDWAKTLLFAECTVSNILVMNIEARHDGLQEFRRTFARFRDSNNVAKDTLTLAEPSVPRGDLEHKVGTDL